MTEFKSGDKFRFDETGKEFTLNKPFMWGEYGVSQGSWLDTDGVGWTLTDLKHKCTRLLDFEIPAGYVECKWSEATHAMCVRDEIENEKPSNTGRWQDVGEYAIGGVYRVIDSYTGWASISAANGCSWHCPHDAFIPLRKVEHEIPAGYERTEWEQATHLLLVSAKDERPYYQNEIGNVFEVAQMPPDTDSNGKRYVITYKSGINPYLDNAIPLRKTDPPTEADELRAELTEMYEEIDQYGRMLANVLARTAVDVLRKELLGDD